MLGSPKFTLVILSHLPLAHYCHIVISYHGFLKINEKALSGEQKLLSPTPTLKRKLVYHTSTIYELAFMTIEPFTWHVYEHSGVLNYFGRRILRLWDAKTFRAPLIFRKRPFWRKITKSDISWLLDNPQPQFWYQNICFQGWQIQLAHFEAISMMFYWCFDQVYDCQGHIWRTKVNSIQLKNFNDIFISETDIQVTNGVIPISQCNHLM